MPHQTDSNASSALDGLLHLRPDIIITAPGHTPVVLETRGCEHEGCEAGHYARGLCAQHYNQLTDVKARKAAWARGEGRRTTRLCEIEGCDGLHVARGLCRRHYEQQPEKKAQKLDRERKRNQRPEVRERIRMQARGRYHERKTMPPPKPSRLCQVEECDEGHFALGLCLKHYHREYAQRPEVKFRSRKRAQRPEVKSRRRLTDWERQHAPREGARLCSIEGCERGHSARGLCVKHYTQDRSARRRGEHYDPHIPRPPGRPRGPARLCTIEGCGKRHAARGLCFTHYKAEYYLEQEREYRRRPEVKERRKQRDRERGDSDPAFKAHRQAYQREYQLKRSRKIGGNGYRKHRGYLHAKQAGRCAGCRNHVLATGGDSHVDHIVPVKLGGTNDLANLQLLCPRCNQTKQAKPMDECRGERRGQKGRGSGRRGKGLTCQWIVRKASDTMGQENQGV